VQKRDDKPSGRPTDSGRKITVRAIPKESIDRERFVAALVAMAMARVDKERHQK
jgi:hypothetical protein